MRQTIHSDYALRVLMYLCARPDDRTTIEEIARVYGISQNHLMKVVNNLARHGWVEAQRGRGGGLKLALDPEEITVGAVIRTTEEDFDLVACFRADDACPISAACQLKRSLARALDAYFAVLDGVTLASLVRQPRRLFAAIS
jgi:Rrf2 family nitric oxide-sensitive transcriptional repressor